MANKCCDLDRVWNDLCNVYNNNYIRSEVQPNIVVYIKSDGSTIARITKYQDRVILAITDFSKDGAVKYIFKNLQDLNTFWDM
jgi:hypothetical protein